MIFKKVGEKQKSLSYGERESVKLLENPAILAAKVATFNEGSNISGQLFATI